MINISMKNILFICGTPHSGSTLLGLLLGSHSMCFYAGEMNNIEFFNDFSVEEYKRQCRMCGINCEIWSKIVKESTENYYQQLNTITGKSFIIDSTKNLKWLEKQLNTLKNDDCVVFLIQMQRDGRAAINSMIRKYPNRDIVEIINTWKNQIEITDKFYNEFNGRKMRVRYEELCSYPSSTLMRVCSMLNLEYESQMLEYYDIPHHPIGGNIGTQYLLVKSKNQSIGNDNWILSAQNQQYYKDHPLKISLDLRWKKELDPKCEELFHKIVGNLNSELEWE